MCFKKMFLPCMITSFRGQKSRKNARISLFCLLIKLGLTFNSVVDALWFKGCENNSVLKSYNGGPWKKLKGLRLHLKARTRHKTHANNRRIATLERTATTLKRLLHIQVISTRFSTQILISCERLALCSIVSIKLLLIWKHSIYDQPMKLWYRSYSF